MESYMQSCYAHSASSDWRDQSLLVGLTPFYKILLITLLHSST